MITWAYSVPETSALNSTSIRLSYHQGRINRVWVPVNSTPLLYVLENSVSHKNAFLCVEPV